MCMEYRPQDNLIIEVQRDPENRASDVFVTIFKRSLKGTPGHDKCMMIKLKCYDNGTIATNGPVIIREGKEIL